jgi:hypothetical protein
MDPHANQRQAVLVEAEEFLVRLSEEIARSDRYEHAFTLLVLLPPVVDGETPPAAWLESLATGLIRGCDIVTIFEGQRAIAALLPETGVSGGNALLERFRSAIGDTDCAWQARLLEYPANREAIIELTEEAA